MTLGIRFGACAAIALAIAAGATTAFQGAATWKGVAPVDAACDRLDKSRPAWTACVDAAKAEADDARLFYAGYWLARKGAYEEALAYLRRARRPDERILTYTGFATRKLGEVNGALTFYEQALVLNPDYTVARAYLGEAFLSLGELSKAKEQLAEVEKRCGARCAEYAELAAGIARHEGAERRGG